MSDKPDDATDLGGKLPVVRNEKGQLQPGSRLNPSGQRRLQREFLANLESRCYTKALDNLNKGLESQDWKERQWSTELTLAYLIGKPASQVQITGEDGKPVDVAVGLYSLLKRLVDG